MTKLNQFCFALLCGCLALVALEATAQTGQSQPGQLWMVTASNVRVRAVADVNGEELTRLSLGTVVRQLDNPPQAATINGKKDFWYPVTWPNGKDGWVFGSFLTRYDETRKGEIIARIAAQRTKAETGSFAEFVELARWLETVNSPPLADRNRQAELELRRWIAVHRALEQIPMDKLEEPEYQRFIKTVQPHITYSDPAGMWFIKAEVLWQLAKKYADTPVADLIAWEAAQLPLPGECEGDAACGLTYSLETSGRYLQLYPNGKYADAALNRLLEGFQDTKGIYEGDTSLNGKPSAATKQEIRRLIAKLRNTYVRSTNPKKAQLDAALNKLAALYR